MADYTKGRNNFYSYNALNPSPPNKRKILFLFWFFFGLFNHVYYINLINTTKNNCHASLQLYSVR